MENKSKIDWKHRRHGLVYVMSGGNSAPCKIGHTLNLKLRIKSMQTYQPTKVRVHYRKKCSSVYRAKRLELLVHQKLEDYRLMGEWFNLPPKKCRQAIEEVASKYQHCTLKEMDAVLKSKKKKNRN